MSFFKKRCSSPPHTPLIPSLTEKDGKGFEESPVISQKVYDAVTVLVECSEEFQKAITLNAVLTERVEALERENRLLQAQVIALRKN